MEETFYIWSIEHSAWWGPDSHGYTYNKDEAGLYPKREAYEIVNGANRYRKSNFPPNEALVPN